MVGGLLISMGVGGALAANAFINGHGFWWALFNYSAGGIVTFIAIAAAILGSAHLRSMFKMRPQPELSGAIYAVAPIPVKRTTK